ncbi:hypothetical protein MMC17_003706 [Xylographa soralifera]|nr:hypothetical protein [Xylographa soralifera]
MPPRAKMLGPGQATPPVTPAKNSAKPSRITRAVAFAAHLQAVAETDDSTAETKAAKKASDTNSTSDTTNAEDSTEACVDTQGRKQAAGAKNTASNKKAPATKKPAAKKPAAKKPAVKKQAPAQEPAATNAPANKGAATLKSGEASAQAESTEDEEPSEEVEAAKQTPLKKMPPPQGGRAVRQPPAINRQGIQARPSNPRGGGNNEGLFLYPNDFPSAVPLSQTRFQGHGQVLPVVKYTDAGYREPFYIFELSNLREKLLTEIPCVFHQEREHRLANEALGLAREYVSALMYQEMNKNSLIRQHMDDSLAHERNGVEFSAEEKKKRSDLLEDLENPKRLEKINELHRKMKDMERGLQYCATEAEEEARVKKLKAEAEEKKKKGGKGKGKAAEIAETGEDEIGGEEADEVEEADDEGED